MNDRNEIRKKIEKWFDNNTDAMIDDLGQIIAINSVRSPAEENAPFGKKSREVLNLAQKMLEKRGFTVNVFDNMLITAETGQNPPLMGLLAHLDIVAAGEGWESDPFTLTFKDGNLYGRGVMDNKGPSVACMYAMYCVRDLFPDLKHGVQILLGSAEETGFDDIISYRETNILPPNVFTPDAGFPLINVEKGRYVQAFGAKWEKSKELPRIVSITGGKTQNVVPNHATAVIEGFSKDEAETFCKEFTTKTGVNLSVSEELMLTITAEGTAAHASMPERGNNAQTALIKMLTSMPFAESESFLNLKALDRLFPHGDNHGKALGVDMKDDIAGRITVNFGVLRFDELEFSGNFDSRTPICADKTDLTDMTRYALENEGLSVSYFDIIESHHVPEDSRFVKNLLRVYEEYTGKPGYCYAMGGLTYAHGIPGGVAFGCTMPDDDNRVHGASEYISKEQLILSAKMFAMSIVDFCNPDD